MYAIIQLEFHSHSCKNASGICFSTFFHSQITGIGSCLVDKLFGDTRSNQRIQYLCEGNANAIENFSQLKLSFVALDNRKYYATKVYTSIQNGAGAYFVYVSHTYSFIEPFRMATSNYVIFKCNVHTQFSLPPNGQTVNAFANKNAMRPKSVRASVRFRRQVGTFGSPPKNNLPTNLARALTKSLGSRTSKMFAMFYSPQIERCSAAATRRKETERCGYVILPSTKN